MIIRKNFLCNTVLTIQDLNTKRLFLKDTFEKMEKTLLKEKRLWFIYTNYRCRRFIYTSFIHTFLYISFCPYDKNIKKPIIEADLVFSTSLFDYVFCDHKLSFQYEFRTIIFRHSEGT